MIASIIIAVKTWQKNLEECVGKCLELDFSDFEILIMPDNPIDRDFSQTGNIPVEIIPTGPVSPAKKRDTALNHAKGEILAFIDDDAYPDKGWLRNAIENFKDNEIAAVGGPAVTPLNDSLSQKASGAVYASFFVSGINNYRYLPRKRMVVDDYPSCNFLLRKSIMQELEGFKTNFWPGEDTKLCLDITQKLKKKIIYDPRVLVYHHRRPLFRGHLKQIASYGLHRGYFVKKFPHTSLRIAYFIPSLILIVVLGGGISSLFLASLRNLYLMGLCLYVLLVFIFSIFNELRLVPLVFFGIILTHFTYGLYFLKGLLSRRLKEE